MSNFLFLLETLASLSVAFCFWAAIILLSIGRKTWIRFIVGTVVTAILLLGVQDIRDSYEFRKVENSGK